MPVHKAIDGVYDRGEVHLDQEPALDYARVTVVFYEAPNGEAVAGRRGDFGRFARMLPPEATAQLRRSIEDAFEQVEEEA